MHSRLLNLHLYQAARGYKGLLWVIPREQEEKLVSEEVRGMAVIQQGRHTAGHWQTQDKTLGETCWPGMVFQSLLDLHDILWSPSGVAASCGAGHIASFFQYVDFSLGQNIEVWPTRDPAGTGTNLQGRANPNPGQQSRVGCCRWHSRKRKASTRKVLVV